MSTPKLIKFRGAVYIKAKTTAVQDKNTVYVLSGLVWSAAGKSSYLSFGPYASLEEANEATKYSQMHPLVKQYQVSDDFYDYVKMFPDSAELRKELIKIKTQ